MAKDWFLSMSGKARAGLITAEKTFRTAAERFTLEYGMITDGQRAMRWVEGHQIRLRLHLLPFFGHLGLSGVTPSQVQDYGMHRITSTIAVAEKAGKVGKAPSRSTIHDEIGTLRLVLKTGTRHGWLAHLPDLSPPYKTSGKIVHRPWSLVDQLFGNIRSVGICGIDKIYTQFRQSLKRCDRLWSIFGFTPNSVTGDPHGPKT